jgi:hypothetical protein
MMMTLRKYLMVVLWTIPFFFNGCAIIKHDAEIDKKRLADDLVPAEALAHQLGQKDLGCSNIKTDELSAKPKEGAPQGPVWSNFIIQVSGCGKVKTYKIQCEIESTCFRAEE